MSWTLRPTYYKTNFNNTTSQTDMLLFSSYRGLTFGFLNTVFGPQTLYRLYFYYDIDGISLEKIHTKIVFTSEYTRQRPNAGDIERSLVVAPFIADLNGDKIEDYADEKSETYYTFNSSNGDKMYSFDFDFSGSHLFNNERLGLEILFPVVTDTNFGAINFTKAPVVYADGIGTNNSSNNSYTPKELSSAISNLYRNVELKTNTLNYSPSGILFFDYDGKILYSFDRHTFLSLNDMPINPVHPGLISRGWNWSLERAKAYVKKYGNLDIGQMYSTTDGKTRLYVNICTESLLNYTFPLLAKGNIKIDWGDGESSEYSVTSGDTLDTTIFNELVNHGICELLDGEYYDGSILNASHKYKEKGHYVISIDASYGKIVFVNLHGDLGDITEGPWVGDDDAFIYKAAVEKIEIGDNTIIGDFAFSYFRNLKTALIPYNCEIVGACAFSYCNSLYALVIPNSLNRISSYFFSIYGRNSVYMNDTVFISLPESLNELGGGAFYGLASLVHITIPDSITKIENIIYHNEPDSPFYSCLHLSYIVIPDDVKSINDKLFANCESLTSIALPLHLTSIGSKAFLDCSSLRQIELEESITSIGNNAFDGCSALSYIETPSKIPVISEGIFRNCESLDTVIIKDGPTEIQDDAFNGCVNLQNISLPESITSIGRHAFYECNNLHSIIFPSKLESIGEGTFSGYDYSLYGAPLTKIVFKTTVPPTLQDYFVFSGVIEGCMIYIPRGTYSAYTSAQNYPSTSRVTYVEYDDVSDVLADSVEATVENNILMLSGSVEVLRNKTLNVHASNAYEDSSILTFVDGNIDEQSTEGE